MKVSIIGQGYVGLTISAFAGQTHGVIGFDTNSEIVDRLNQGISHIEGVESSLILELISKGKYKATTNETEINGSELLLPIVKTILFSSLFEKWKLSLSLL